MLIKKLKELLKATTIVFLFLNSTSYADTLTILNWEGYLSNTVIESWEKETGHKIVQIYYDSDEDRDIILSRGAHGIDLVVTDETSVLTFGENGTLLPLSQYKNVNNIEFIDSSWQNRCGDHALAYLWGTLGVVYRKDIFEKKPESWKVILNPTPPAKMHIGLLEDYSDMLGPALFSQGYSFNTENKDELKETFELMKKVMPYILTMDYSISYVEGKGSHNDLYIALAYSGDQHILNEKANADLWSYTTLKEGTTAWGDCFSVVTQSEKHSLAFNFLNHLYLPKNAAINSEELGVAVPMSKARALQSEGFRYNHEVYPPEAMFEKLQFYKRLSPDNILLRNRITNSLVKIYESQ